MSTGRSTTDLLIIGAGPAGLAHAFWRREADPSLDVLVVDRQARAGGWVQTCESDGYACELGPQGIRPNEDSDALISALGIESEVIPASPLATRRFLGRDQRLLLLPEGPGGLVKTGVFTFAGKLSLCMEPLRKPRNIPDESLAGFVGRRFGREAVPLAEALANGVFGGDAHDLELAAAFPTLKHLESEHGSLVRGMIARRRAHQGRPKRPALHSFRGGMRALVTALCAPLGDRLRLSAEVTALHHDRGAWIAEFADGSTIAARKLVLAVPAAVASGLLRPTCAELAQELWEIPFASIANIYLGYPRAEVEDKLSGFGFLMDRREKSPMLGAIYCSSIFPKCSPPDRFLVRVMAGGVTHPGVLNETDQALTQRADAMLRAYTGIESPCEFRQVMKATAAIPQYTAGHSQRVARIRELASARPGLRLLGNSYDAVSVVGQLGRPGREHTAAP